MLGTATGGILSGLMVQFLPAPTHLVYVLLGGIFIAQTIGVAAMPESVVARPGALASLRPTIHLPPVVRAPMVLATPALIAAWALAGFYLSLGPAVVRRLAASNSLLAGGLAVFVFASCGAVTVFLTREWQPKRVLALGGAALAAGVAIGLAAIAGGSVALFAVGTIVAGAGFGASFQGAIRSVLVLAPPAERAGVLSLVYVISYVAMGVPAILAGVRVVHGGGLTTTAREYGLVVIALSLAALTGVLAPASRRPRRQPTVGANAL
jgi:hypothetical protein